MCERQVLCPTKVSRLLPGQGAGDSSTWLQDCLFLFHCLSDAILSAASKLHHWKAPGLWLVLLQPSCCFPLCRLGIVLWLGPFSPGGSRCQLFIANVIWEWQKGLGLPVVTGRGPASIDTGRSLETCYQHAWRPDRQQQWVLAHGQGLNLE